MLAFDWLEQTDKIGCNIFPARINDLRRAMVPDCFGTLSSTLCRISVCLEGGNWVICFDNTIFLKWGILNVPFCSIFVPFQFYLVMTLVVPSLNNIFMVLLISALGNFKSGATKPIFWILLPLRVREGGVMHVRAWFVIIV